MSRVIKVEDVVNMLNEYEKIDDPIVVQRENKDDVVILSLEEYRETMKEKDIINHLKKSEDDIKNGKTVPAKDFFEELRAKYGY